MSRKPRVLFEGALYHVTSRGNARQVIFHRDVDRERFLAQLGDQVAACGVVVYAIVLMDNHYHLLVRTPKGNLSRFMQRVNTSYALYYRYRHERPGHVFQGRYTARLVTEDRYLLALTRYLHLNPVKTAYWRKAPREDVLARLNGYRWSSYRSYVSGRPGWPWLSLHALGYYGGSAPRAAARYRAYTEAMITGDDEELMVELRRAEGGAGKVPAAKGDGKITTGSPFDWDAMDEVVAAHFGLARSALIQHGHVAGAAKRVALELAARRSGASLRVIGERYGGLGPNAVSMNRARLRPEDRTHLALIEKEL